MTAEEIQQLQARVTRLETENVTLRAAATEVVALSGTLALGSGATPSAVTGAVSGLLALRAEVRKITGQDSDAAALGVLEAHKEKAAQADGLIAASAKIASDALAAELNGVLDDGIKAAKIAPFERDVFEAAALSKGAGKPSKDGIAYLRAKLEATTAKKVSTEAVDQKKQTGEIAAAARVVGAQMGISLAEYELFKTDRPAWEAQQVEKRNGVAVAR